MEFSEAIKIVKDVLKDLGSNIDENAFDGIMVKRLEMSNTLDEGKSGKQTHIAITGSQMDMFPYVRADGYFDVEYDQQDSILKKYFIAQIPVYLHKDNILYLDSEKTVSEGEQLAHVCIVRSRRKDDSEQIQMSMINMDSPEFIEYRRIVHAKSCMILLKRKEKLFYDIYCVKDEDVNEDLQGLNGSFYKLPTSTAVKLDDILIDDSKEDNYRKELLSASERDCAQKIIDEVYLYDRLSRLNDFFEITEKSVKLSIEKMDVEIPSGNFLRGVFVRPSSDMYNDAIRVFDKEYSIPVDNSEYVCKLTTQWKNSNPTAGDNYLKSLIEVVNAYYKGAIEIVSEGSDRYILIYDKEFKLPKEFADDFSRRFITSLLAKKFVILTGNSGTGKTRISKKFAEYMQVDFEKGKKNWILVPVGADWTDNTKILGFYNPLADDGHGKYEKTEILRMIEIANRPENKDVPFFLILDEMNLSHVERYFADFLSHMETPELPFILDGYAKEGETGLVKYPNNLFVIGTVNIDETTYMFSPKVLDRANVIEFKPEKSEVLGMFINPKESSEATLASHGEAEAFTKLANRIQSGASELDDSKLERIKEVFEDIYDAVEKCGYEFAYRTAQEIRQYVSGAYELADDKENFNVEKAIDEQLIQKILPKVHGNKKEIGQLLDKMEELCGKYKLTLSAQKIEKMKGKLAQIQYASFI